MKNKHKDNLELEESESKGINVFTEINNILESIPFLGDAWRIYRRVLFSGHFARDIVVNIVVIFLFFGSILLLVPLPLVIWAIITDNIVSGTGIDDILFTLVICVVLAIIAYLMMLLAIHLWQQDANDEEKVCRETTTSTDKKLSEYRTIDEVMDDCFSEVLTQEDYKTLYKDVFIPTFCPSCNCLFHHSSDFAKDSDSTLCNDCYLKQANQEVK